MTTQAIKAERVRAARHLLLSGYGYTEVVHALMQQYDVSDRTAKTYIEEARLDYVQTPDALQEDSYLDYQRTEKIFQHAVSLDRPDIALNAVNQRQKLRKEMIQYGATQSQFSAEQGLSDTLAAALSDLTHHSAPEPES